MMSLLPFWALNVVVALLSMEGQKADVFHYNNFILCSEDLTGVNLINDRI